MASQRSSETLREPFGSEGFYSQVFRKAGLAAFVVDPVNDEIIDFNDAACDLLGYTREELKTKRVSDIHPDEMALFRTFASSVTSRGQARSDELTCLTRGRGRVPAEISASSIEIAGRQCILALVRDISDRRMMETTLRENEERFRTVVDQAADGMLIADSEGRLLDVNQAACEMLGYPSEEILGKSLRDFAPDIDPASLQRDWFRELNVPMEPEPEDSPPRYWVERGPEVAEAWRQVGKPRASITSEELFRRKSGSTFPAELRFGLVEVGDFALYVVMMRDVTERKYAEHASRELAVFEERNRLARELHDSVTQSLYSLTLFAEAARRSDDAGQVHEYLDQLGQTSKQALREMRLLVYELRPDVLDSEGLIGALRHRLEAVEERAGISTHLLVEGDDPAISEGAEQALYGVAQEALNNSLKHAGASRVTVSLCSSEDQVTLDIEDDGSGFVLESDSQQAGMGLSSMFERMESVGGSLMVESELGLGTLVRATLKPDR